MKEINEIDGILLTPLKIIPGEMGNVLHAMKKTDPGFSGFGEAYFSTVEKGKIKGWKKHLEMTLNLVVISGIIKFIAYDDREDSKTMGEFGSVELSRNNYYRLTVPPKIWLSFSGIGEENILLNIANLLHDPKEANNMPIENIQGGW
ncbi:MAG: dTDP-4-dehydrorhamnose 3,5-epimerase family protein [Leptospiraceae bacterium]|nr:dTDP-4-dehydrorhamnose 3,5-epimerase family protein [Leptospiraceae bacterium]MCP5503341.1 dTDP-4-dehydrorhamnose 3,5-epimerase family protein [Leptospiraceae bacterium]